MARSNIFSDFCTHYSAITIEKKEFDEIKWLKQNIKPDKKSKKRSDIILIFEIIANTIYWRDTFTSTSPRVSHFNYYNVVLINNFLTIVTIS